ncbi:MAG: TrbC/VirB2 family type IV secretion system protein [Gammaproteobacteria bacterium]
MKFSIHLQLKPARMLSLGAGAGILLTPVVAQAAGTLPWDGILETLVNDLSGTTARLIATLLLIVLGFLVAFGEVRGFLSLFIRVALGLSLVFFASSWLNLFFS